MSVSPLPLLQLENKGGQKFVLQTTYQQALYLRPDMSTVDCHHQV